MNRTRWSAIVIATLTLGLVGTVGAHAPSKKKKTVSSKVEPIPQKPMTPDTVLPAKNLPKGYNGTVYGFPTAVETDADGGITEIKFVQQYDNDKVQTITIQGCGAKLANLPQLDLDPDAYFEKDGYFMWSQTRITITNDCLSKVRRSRRGEYAPPYGLVFDRRINP